MPQRGVVTEFFSLDEFERQKKIVQDGIKEYIETVEKIPEIRVNVKNADAGIKESVEGMRKLAEENKKVANTSLEVAENTRKLEENQKRLNKSINDVVNSNQEASDSYTNLLRVAAQNQVANEKMLEIRRRLRAEYKAGRITEEEYTQGLEALKEQQVQIQESNKQVNAGLRNLERVFSSAAGSLDQMNGALAVLQQAYRGLSEEEKNSPIGKETQKEIEALINKVREEEKKIGDFRKNVGRYAESLADGFELVRREITKLQTEQDKLNRDGASGPDASNTQKTRYEEVSRSLEDLNRIQTISLDNNKSFTQVLRGLDQEFINLTHSTGVSNEFLGQFKKFIADSKREAADLKKEMKLIGSETRTINALAESAHLAASSFELVAGAQALFGKSSEAVERITQKLVAIQSLANGVREIARGVTDKGTVANRIYAAVQNQVAIATNKTATAQQRWSAVLKLSVVGLLITGLTLLISKMNLFGESTEAAEESLRTLNIQLEKTNRLTDVNMTALNLRNQILIEQARRRGATEQEISNLVIDGYNNEIKEYEKRGTQLKYIFKGVANSVGRDTNLVLDLTFANITNVQEAVDILNTIDNYKITDFYKKLGEGAKKNIEALETAGKAIYDNFKQIETSGSGAVLENEKQLSAISDSTRKYYERQGQATLKLEAMKYEAAAEAQRRIVEIDILSIDTRIKALRKEASLRSKIISEQVNYELSLDQMRNKDQQMTENERALVYQEGAKKIREIQVKLSYEIAKQRFDLIYAEKQRFDETLSDAEREEAQFAADIIQRKENELEAEEKLLNKSIANSEIERDKKLATLNDEFTKGLISKEKYEKEKYEIEKKYAKEGLSIQIGYYTRLLNTAGLTKEEQLNAERELARLRKELTAIGIADDTVATEKKIELQRQLRDTIIEFAVEAAESVATIIGASFERRKNEIAEEISLLDERRAKEIEVVNQTVTDEKEKADKIAVIEARADAQKQIMENRQKRLEIERAKLDKAVSLLRVAVDTATKVFQIKAQAALLLSNPLTAPYVPIALAQIPFVIGSGILAAAAIAATPIPKYRGGRSKNDPYEGVGYVGDGGRKEAIVRADGTLQITPDRPTLAWFNRGDEVIPDASRLIEALKKPGNIGIAGDFPMQLNEATNYQHLENTIGKKLDTINSTISNKKEVYFERPPAMERIVKHKQGNREYFKMNGFDA